MKPKLFSSLAISRRLPLLTFALLLSVILVFGVISYLGVRKAALKVGHERLQTLSEQFSNMLSANIRTLISASHTAANKPSVKAYLLSNGKDSADEVKRLFQELQKDSSYVAVQLRNPEKAVLLNSSKNGIEQRMSVDSFLSSAVQPNIDSGRVGKIYAAGDSVFYPIIATITSNDTLIGYLIRWRRMMARSKSVDQISQLMGTNAKLYIGNVDESLWTDTKKPVSPPLVMQDTKQVAEFARSSNNVVLVSVHPIANSRWMAAVEFPKNKILQTAHTFLYWLVISGLCLLVAGTFCGWLMSRSISRPLVKLTAATSEIAAGKYSSSVPVTRFDELGVLAHSFNAMTVQVQNSQKELEEKAENYRLLFEKNPLPMWIILKSTLGVSDVNEAAVRHYGYTKIEFLTLNSKDLRPEEDVAKYLQWVSKKREKNKHGIWRHKRKDGTIILVDVFSDDIKYKGLEASLILVNDVTEKLKAEAELIQHRIMQQELITETTILVQEKEREELGRELHDNINQILASAKLYVELAAKGDSNLYREALAKGYEGINLAISGIRQLSKQLVPPALDTALTDTLRDLTREIEAITPISFLLHAENFDECFLSDEIKLMIYRIVQEQVNNILKYAAASTVDITIETKNGHLYLKIEDNGVGFDTNKKSKGIGLRNIVSRAKFYKGTVTIDSRAGRGCRLIISIPIMDQNKAAI